MDDNKKINLAEDDDMQVESTLASIYAAPQKTVLFDREKDEEVKIYEASRGTSKKVTNELDKTAIIERSNYFPEINFKSNDMTEEIEQPYQPEVFNLANPANRRTAERKKARIREEKKRQKRKYQMRRTFIHIFGSILLIIFIISVSAFFSYYIINSALDFTGIVTNEFEVEIEIPEHATTEEIADILSENGIISMPEFFSLYSRVSGADGDYLNGLFSLSSSMSYNSIIASLQNVNRVTETVTVRIREGMTAVEIGQLLEENFVCKASDFEYYYKNKQNKYNFEKRVLLNSKKFHQLEGYLFPDTYEFYVINELVEGKDIDTGSYAEEVANKIYSNYNSKITKEMYKKINEMGFTLDEFMTLASMVQAEAGTVEDMYLVASVFLNRLRNSSIFPKLQSDVTILYAESVIRPHVTIRNEGIYNPIIKAYNTYETDGLPSGPICNPGIDAMEAVLNAPDTDYFYFCANEDTLEMFYATTIQEHEYNLTLAGLA